MTYIKQLICCLILLVAFSSNSFGQAHPYNYLVLFPPGTPISEINDIRDEFNSTELGVSPVTQTRLWQVDFFPYVYRGDTIRDMHEHVPRVTERIEPQGSGFNYTALIAGNDSSNSSSTGNDVQNDCNGTMSTFTDTDLNPVKVGVFDSGLNYYGNFNPNYYFELDTYAEKDYIDGDNIADDGLGHGTHLTSIISHTINKHTGQNGGTNVNEEYDIRKVFDNEGKGTLAEIIFAMEEAVLAGVQVFNFSWSFMSEPVVATNNPFYHSMKRLAIEYGVLFVVAAGNSEAGVDIDQHEMHYPAGYNIPTMITATSYNCSNDLATFANYGQTSVDIALPGIELAGLDHIFSQITLQSGTSHSTALLSGIASILATHQTVFDAEEIICAIMTSALPQPALQGKIKSGGIVDADGALNVLLSGACGQTGGNGGDDLPPGAGDKDSFVSNPSFMDEPIQIYPNPVTDNLTVVYASEFATDIDMVITDHLGRVMIQNTQRVYEGQNKMTFNTDNMLPGLYVVQIASGNTIESYKFVKK